MNIWIAILGFFASGITCFAIGVRICGWGKQSIAEEYDRLLMQQEDAWIKKFSAVRLLYYELIATMSRTGDTTHPACLDLREEIDKAFSTYLPKD